MAIVWRITSSKLAATAFSGDGSKKYGGRWNSIGTSAVYTAESLSLAALELIVHGVNYTYLKNHVYISAEIPDKLIQAIDMNTLPANWRGDPPPLGLQQYGDNWIASQKTAVLKVPSVIIPLGYNYVINPNHKDFSQIRIAPPIQFFIDPRVMKDVSGKSS